MFVIVGGGLSGSLLAYRIAQMQNPPPFLLLEKENQLGGNHTWSFHASDLNPEEMTWISPLISKSWNRQEVIFPGHQRNFSQPYHSILSQDFSERVSHVLGSRLRLNTAIREIQPDGVILESGEKIHASLIFDARGLQANQYQPCGYQKFVGLDLEFKSPHRVEAPIIMDAQCIQKEGFRFFYFLPWSPTQMLIEDTRYSNTPDIDPEDFSREIHALCQRRNWAIRSIKRSEQAALPIPLYTSLSESEWSNEKGRRSFSAVIKIGLNAGFFHLTTGYSIGYAARIAEVIAQQFENHLGTQAKDLHPHLLRIQKECYRQSRFLAFLNRMLFRAAQPSERWAIFSRFYKLPEDTIFRFYRGELRWQDRLRILTGKPPVPVLSALRQIQTSRIHPEKV